MNLNQEFLEIINYIDKRFSIPYIDEIFIPDEDEFNKDCKKSNFGAVKLENGSIGIFFVGLHSEFHRMAANIDIKSLTQETPLQLASKMNSNRLFYRTVGLGVVNAISHYVFLRSKFDFTYTNNILDALHIQPDDTIGMVGYFPPLVKKIKELDNKLIVVELKKEFIRKESNWEITLDTTALKTCNKIICTSTTIINDTLDNILKYTQESDIFSLIGPTAGFLPDPIFDRKIDIVGGSIVDDSHKFFDLISSGERWGNSVKKFIINKESYSGFKELINKIS
jgi:uncharacterized protein (DUF4213/DUF364 family)